MFGTKVKCYNCKKSLGFSPYDIIGATHIECKNCKRVVETPRKPFEKLNLGRVLSFIFYRFLGGLGSGYVLGFFCWRIRGSELNPLNLSSYQWLMGVCFLTGLVLVLIYSMQEVNKASKEQKLIDNKRKD